VEVIVNVQAEGRAILQREVGKRDYVTNDEIFAHMAKNLGRQPEAELATVMLDRAESQQEAEYTRERHRQRSGYGLGM
jgi:homoserine kinase